MKVDEKRTVLTMAHRGKKGGKKKSKADVRDKPKAFSFIGEKNTLLALFVTVIILAAIGSWFVYDGGDGEPNIVNFIDRSIYFPRDEGKHNDTSETWSIYMNLVTENGHEIGLFTAYNFIGNESIRTTRITDNDGVSGDTYYYNTSYAGEITAAYNELNIAWNSISETDRWKSTNTSALYSYEYHHESDLFGEPLLWLDSTLSSNKMPTLWGSEGKIFLYDYGTIFGYFQSRLDVQGSVRIGTGDLESFEGEAWIEHTWGYLSMSDIETLNLQLDDSTEVYLARLYIPGTNDIGLEYLYYIYPNGTYDVNKLGEGGNYSTIYVNEDYAGIMQKPTMYSVETTRFWIDPRDALQRRCYASEWRFYSESKGMDILVKTSIPNQLAEASWTGTLDIFDRETGQAAGKGFATLVHDYKSLLSINSVTDNREVLDTPHDPTTVRANVTDGIPLANITLIYSIDGGENISVPMVQSSADPYFWEASIPGQPYVGTVVEYRVLVYNLADVMDESDTYSYTVKIDDRP